MKAHDPYSLKMNVWHSKQARQNVYLIPTGSQNFQALQFIQNSPVQNGLSHAGAICGVSSVSSLLGQPMSYHSFPNPGSAPTATVWTHETLENGYCSQMQVDSFHTFGSKTLMFS